MLITQALTLSVLHFVLTSGAEIRNISVDLGRNLSLPCSLPDAKNIMWVHEGKEARQVSRLLIQDDGSLFLMEVDRNDSGIYTCLPANSDSPDVKASVGLRVRTPPPLLSLSVHPSTILALVLWTVEDTGGYPIICFTAQYRLANSSEEWKPISPNRISPNSRQIEVYKLEPNTTYAFRVWGINQLGKGDVAEIEGRTLMNNQDLELARHFLEGADKFDTRMWLVAVGVVMGTLVVLGLGTCFLLYQECRAPSGKF
ncbi:protein sidekick-1 isoform X4 [Photinus pyralis]|uniref:Fibronectin type-III domain-containing protein n=1 Tax=Photinus pyralis TaxID=7054 RepID=A0A1Y1JZU3_PHOPY|nr:protein sidekick-1 isoform X4 [Photinus pyralis]